MELNRREFLKALGVGLAVSALPIGALDTYPQFDPKRQYGNFASVTDTVDKDFLSQVIDEFDEEIKHFIPPKYRKNIRYVIQQPTPTSTSPLSQIGSVSWKYTPEKGSSI